jgi:hypothetical protein
MASTTWRNLLELTLVDWGLRVHVGVAFIGLVAALVVAGAVLARRRAAGWEVTSADFTFGGCANVTICPTDDIAGLAHQAWVEITTRKAALPFDEDNDVIVEVYNSWYELFRALRELAKNVPTRRGLHESSDEAQLVEALIGALNMGLRPHLTRWQARFRRWYDAEQKNEENAGLPPQEIQRRFPQYAELVSDIVIVNEGLVGFAESLRKLAHERKRRPFLGFWGRTRERGG